VEVHQISHTISEERW